ncbi:hypothetical protein D6T64_02350 [Cryobacterium melibiosiphilum]|uniref:Uncharacterized protein n=1 Tax=Cryobacterium melibiosiphilum TaxID=995039 RepID=A0A3A5N1M4_9MICO|nr:hypothetical protein [Cryobacterium melibiosiphilum]RJT91174.1 hypothetical protein D6T64_02350 [Cryobacterium melibiosiphilum]
MSVAGPDLRGTFRIGTTLGLALLAAVSLSGCVGENVNDMFEEPQTAQDVISDDMPATAFEDIDQGSTRLLWVDGDTSYFAALMPDYGLCLMLDDGEAPMSACSRSLPITASGGSGSRTVAFSGPVPDSQHQWEEVADFLWVRQ